jgi:hypothetical protein
VAVQALAEPVAEARVYVQQQPVAYLDETGWRQGQQRAWLWTAVTAGVTVFVIRLSRRGKVAHRTFARYMWPVRHEVERLRAIGQRCGVPKTAGSCREILKLRQALWTFVRHEGVEPTNNTAERAIRPGVLGRKGSFGTQSAEGSRFVEVMMTVVATLKQQHRHVLDYVTAACEAALYGQPAPSLLPTSDALNQGMRPAA